MLSQLKTSKMQMAELLNSSIEVSEKQDRDEKIALKAEELGGCLECMHPSLELLSHGPFGVPVLLFL